MAVTATESTSFFIQTEVAPSYLGDLLRFVYQEYIVPYYQNFANVRRWIDGGREVLAFTLVDPHGLWQIDVELVMSVPLEVKMTPVGSVPHAVLSRLKDDLIIAVQVFEEKIRRTTLYFAWVPERSAVPERTLRKSSPALGRILFGNMLMFFVLFLALSYAVFIVATEVFRVPVEYFPIVMIITQFIMVLFSDKIVKSMGDWPITASSPYAHILQYHVPPEQFEQLQRTYTRDDLLEIKKEIYGRTLAFGALVDVQSAQEVFSRHGLGIRPENLLIRTVNVYEIVKEAAARFRMPVPKIMISNVIMPNAAATGPSPRFGLVLLTTGLLAQLDEKEVLAVVGHELSHVKRRDPIALFALVSVEYLLRVYYFLNFFYYFGMLYFLFSLGVVYFIAKFFEARADLEAAVELGRPELLAGALRKIGYRRLQLERLQQNRIGSWVGWNPHPPISFRVERLESLKEPYSIRHPFIESVKDCVAGLLSELRRL